MRLAILSSLVLVPVLAHGQATTPAQSKPVNPSALYRAEVTQPARLSAIVKGAVKADVASTLNSATPVTVREYISTQLTEDLTQEALRQGGSLVYGFGGSEPNEMIAPKLTGWVVMQLSGDDLASTPGLSQVVLNGTVDEYGFLRNLSVTHSAGTAVDRKALEAVNGFRFKPATVNNQPVQAAMSIAIKIEKQ